METLYIVVRSDLKPGLQAAQAVHAASEFAHAYPDIHRQWYSESKNLVLLQVPSEADLLNWCDKLKAEEISYALWTEPDMNNAATALAVEPSGAKLLSNLPLMLKAA